MTGCQARHCLLADSTLQAFFRNFVTLALFGVVGTFITAALIALGARLAGG